jgi:hypothetical protein
VAPIKGGDDERMMDDYVKLLTHIEEARSAGALDRYTHKTSGFKTSGFKTSGFKTSETLGLQNVRFTKRQVYKMSGLQNVRSPKCLVEKKHPYIFCTGGLWKSAGSDPAMCCRQSEGCVLFSI